MLVLAAWVGPWLAWLAWRGELSGGVFSRGPGRAGSLHAVDLLIALGAWLIGGMLGHSMGMMLVGDGQTGGVVLIRTLAGQAGMIPAIVYVIVRVGMAVRGGVRGWALASAVLPTFGFTVAGILLIIPATMLTLTVGAWVSTQLGHPPDPIAHPLLNAMREAEDPRIVWAFIVSAVVVAPVIEEVIFRGLVQTALLHLGIPPGRWGVIVAGAVLFTVVHVGMPWIALPGLLVLGLGLGYLYERTGSLWSSIVVHGVFNGLNIVAVFAGWVTEAAPG